MQTGRRDFLRHTVGVACGLALAGGTASSRATPAAAPMGFQLYTLGDLVVTDTARVMASLKTSGFSELEAIAYPMLAPEALRRHAEAAGLSVQSVHLDVSSATDPAPLFDTAHRLGAGQVVSSVLAPQASGGAPFDRLTAADFTRIAARANRIGEAARRAGLRYAYHNHAFEFRPVDGGTGYEILLARTDPALVAFQADCGWMSAAGVDPARYFRAHRGRYVSAHIKDFDAIGRAGRPAGHIVELGRGVVDYRPILAAARETGIAHLFVEHDPPDGVPISLDAVAREGAWLRSQLAASPDG